MYTMYGYVLQYALRTKRLEMTGMIGKTLICKSVFKHIYLCYNTFVINYGDYLHAKLENRHNALRRAIQSQASYD